MAITVTTSKGLIQKFYSEKEQSATWKEATADISNWPAYVKSFDKKKELEFFTISEKVIGFEKYEKTVKSNGKTKTFKCTLSNESDKTWKVVNELNGYSK